MKTLTRLLSFGAALLGLIALPRLRPAASLPLMLPRLLAGSFAPYVILAGALGAAMSLIRLDCAGAFAALLGVWAARHAMARIQARRATFDQAFGLGWEKRIPAEAQARMLRRRFSLRLPEPPMPALTANVTIGVSAGGDPLLADIWRPNQSVPRSGLAVIYLHGSGFFYLDKDWHTRPLFRHLAGQGHLIIDVAYTLAPKTTLFGMVADARRALHWAKSHAAELQINPDRVVLMGGSAGGHIALLAAYTPNRPPFDAPDAPDGSGARAAISFYGGGGLDMIEDTTSRFTALPPRARWTANRMMENFARRLKMIKPQDEYVPFQNLAARLLGGSPSELKERAALASPISHVHPDCPPTLLVQGEHDSMNNVAGMKALRRALVDAGVPTVWLDLPYTEHGFDLAFPKSSAAFQSAVYHAQRFLALMV